MQNTSQTYKTLLAAGAVKQVRAIISDRDGRNSVTYGENRIVSATTTASMFGDKPVTIGNCVVKKLRLVLFNPGDIPRMARIRMQFRLTDGSINSEWYPKGTFYIDTRKLDRYSRLVIDAFDPMLKAEQSFTKDGDQGTWPTSDRSVVNTIATALGVSVDSRTLEILTQNYQIEYPGIVLEDGKPQYSNDGAMSMRQVLGYIGSMYGGNWVITDEDKLRLLVLGDIPEGPLGLLIDEDGNYITIGGYRIRVSR